AHRDSHCLVERISVDPAADCRKGDGLDRVLARKRQRVSIARRKKPGLACVAAAPYRSDGMDDETGRQAKPRRDARFAGRAAAQLAACGKQPGPRRAMDGAIDAAAT